MAVATPLRFAAHQRDVGRLERDVGAGADRDADVGPRQRRRVVDAVADHRDDVTLGLQARDLGDLALGRHASDDTADAHLPGDRRRGGGLVAGQQHDLEAPRAQRGRSPRVRRP